VSVKAFSSLLATLLALPVLGLVASGFAQEKKKTFYNDFHLPPHDYYKVAATDRVTRLKALHEKGGIKIEWDTDQEMVEAFCKALDVPIESQVLVFSRTGLQRRITGPENPRALYFSDDVYFGYVPGGFLEIISIDPKLGGIFFLADPRNPEHKFEFLRQEERCLGCHGGNQGDFLPALMLRSTHVGKDGRSLGAATTFLPSHRIPFDTRWGGWFVTGQHGINHLGNAFAVRADGGVRNPPAPKPMTALDRFFDEKLFPVQGSDVVALLVHDHQIGAHNLLMNVHYRVRSELDYHDLDSPEGRAIPLSEGGLEMAQKQADLLARYFLFIDAPDLEGGVQDSRESFRSVFTDLARRDADGRSLRQFNLKSRIFEYRCSYLIHSEAFLQLPLQFREVFWARLKKILRAREAPGDYAKLDLVERTAIYEILKATHVNLPAGW